MPTNSPTLSPTHSHVSRATLQARYRAKASPLPSEPRTHALQSLDLNPCFQPGSDPNPVLAMQPVPAQPFPPRPTPVNAQSPRHGMPTAPKTLPLPALAPIPPKQTQQRPAPQAPPVKQPPPPELRHAPRLQASHCSWEPSRTERPPAPLPPQPGCSTHASPSREHPTLLEQSSCDSGAQRGACSLPAST